MISSDFNFRKAGVNDAAAVRELGIISYGTYENVLKPEHFEKLKMGVSNPDVWMKLLTEAYAVVCESDGKIVGMAFLMPSGDPWEFFQSDWSYLRMVGVHPSCSGKGIAKKLTELCIEKAKENNEKIIALHTSEFMDAARHIYEALGFTVLKEIDPRFGKRYWIYTLSLS